MTGIVKTNIKFQIDEDLLLKLLNTKKTSSIADKALEILLMVEKIVKPKYIIKQFEINKKGNDFVVIGSQYFNSKIIANQLKELESVFVFIATGGKEIEEYLSSISDPFDNYILDQIAYMSYLHAVEDMQNYLLENFNIEKYTSLATGSIQDWNVKEVKKIFKLLGNACDKIGVSVLESGMITPLKSTSGILFETNNVFHSCEICEKLGCPTRKAEFDEEKHIEMMKL